MIELMLWDTSGARIESSSMTHDEKIFTTCLSVLQGLFNCTPALTRTPHIQQVTALFVSYVNTIYPKEKRRGQKKNPVLAEREAKGTESMGATKRERRALSSYAWEKGSLLEKKKSTLGL